MARTAGKSGEDRVAAAQEVLAGEIALLVSGVDWARFLDFQSRLHAYSPNNVLLIVAQHARAFSEGQVSTPVPRCVAGFRTWQSLSRRVERGQHGYAVLAPVRGLRRGATDVDAGPAGPADGEVAGSVRSDPRVPVLRGFKIEHVFDVALTTGAPLPATPLPRVVEGEAPRGLGAAVTGLLEARGYRVATVPDADALGGANGQTIWDTRSVVVRADMDDAAMVKTLIHEAAHVLLHEGPPGRYLARSTKEVEAESVAYVVASVHGMPTGSYSFPYVAAWAGADAARAVRDTQARVARAARAIIAVSPAAKADGGKPPGAAAVVSAGRQGDELAARRERDRVGADGPEVA